MQHGYNNVSTGIYETSPRRRSGPEKVTRSGPAERGVKRRPLADDGMLITTELP